MALRGPAQSGGTTSALVRSEPWRPRPGAQRVFPPGLQIITSCFAEGCPRCTDQSGGLHLVLIPLEPPPRGR